MTENIFRTFSRRKFGSLSNSLKFRNYFKQIIRGKHKQESCFFSFSNFLVFGCQKNGVLWKIFSFILKIPLNIYLHSHIDILKTCLTKSSLLLRAAINRLQKQLKGVFHMPCTIVITELEMIALTIQNNQAFHSLYPQLHSVFTSSKTDYNTRT